MKPRIDRGLHYKKQKMLQEKALEEKRRQIERLETVKKMKAVIPSQKITGL